MLCDALNIPHDANVQYALAQSRNVHQNRGHSQGIHKPAERARIDAITDADSQRKSPFSTRIEVQRARLNLPAFATTTIGSFPQTASIPLARQSYKQGTFKSREYTEAMHSESRSVVETQERLGLDVSRKVQSQQLAFALAIRDEVVDLEWAVQAFRLCASGVRNETLIQTHMCYSQFNDVIKLIAEMGADVIDQQGGRRPTTANARGLTVRYIHVG